MFNKYQCPACDISAKSPAKAPPPAPTPGKTRRAFEQALARLHQPERPRSATRHTPISTVAAATNPQHHLLETTKPHPQMINKKYKFCPPLVAADQQVDGTASTASASMFVTVPCSLSWTCVRNSRAWTCVRNSRAIP